MGESCLQGVSQMQVCPHCQKENSDQDVYCYACGHILPHGLQLDGETSKFDVSYETLEPQRRWGTAYFDRANKLRLTFRDTGETLDIAVASTVVLGRAHSEPGVIQPDVDLSPFGAIEKGVSRTHLEFARDYDTVIVTDLGSSNSTFLNGQRILPFEPRILRDNDELRLGHLVVQVAFV